MAGAGRLNPIINLADQEYWLATHELFAVDRRILQQPVGNVVQQRDALIAALDLVFTGI